MKEYQFKTNINCSGCVAKVTPLMNQNPEIKEWNVDTTNPQKILTVKTENLDQNGVKSIIAKAGFNAESI